MSIADGKRKLLLFDIDGTLILSGGRGKKALIAAAEAELTHPIEMEFRDFAGSTDRLIVAAMVEKHGIRVENLESTIDRILEKYIIYLKKEVAGNGTVEVLPGVRELLNAVTDSGEFGLGLLTGNIEAGARIKLKQTGLNSVFNFGAFGCDAADRNLLPPIALQRAKNHYGYNFSPKDTWIIGDTPRDIQCAQTNHLRSIAVATTGWSVEELQSCQPDAALPNLTDTEHILNILKT